MNFSTKITWRLLPLEEVQVLNATVNTSETYQTMRELGFFCRCHKSEDTKSALREYIVAREEVKMCTTLSDQALCDRLADNHNDVDQTARKIAHKDASELVDRYFNQMTEINDLAWDRIHAGQDVALKYAVWRERLLDDHLSLNAQGRDFCGIYVPSKVPESLRLENRLRPSEGAWALHDSSLQSWILAKRLSKAEAQLDEDIEASYQERQAYSEYTYEGSVISDETYRNI